MAEIPPSLEADLLERAGRRSGHHIRHKILWWHWAECHYCHQQYWPDDSRPTNFCSQICKMAWEQSRREYTAEFLDNTRYLIRKRDNYKCQQCGVRQEDLSMALHVHHLDGNKANNAEENLISLCPRCHGKRKAYLP